MPKTISKILRSEKRDSGSAEYLLVRVEVVDEQGNKEECTVYVGGEVDVILHGQVIKAYVVAPWRRPKQSRKPMLDSDA